MNRPEEFPIGVYVVRVGVGNPKSDKRSRSWWRQDTFPEGLRLLIDDVCIEPEGRFDPLFWGDMSEGNPIWGALRAVLYQAEPSVQSVLQLGSQGSYTGAVHVLEELVASGKIVLIGDLDRVCRTIAGKDQAR